MTPNRRLVWTLLAIAALALCLVYQVKLVGDWRVDDALITFSYSKNLGTGAGPVYSHGVRVEGYSNFLWMVLLSGAYVVRAHPDIYLTSRVLAYGFLVALGVGTYGLARLRAGRVASVAAVFLLATMTDVTRATLSGLETIPYAALLTLGLWAYLTEDTRRRRWSLYLFVAVALMRIDGCVPLAFVLAFEVVRAVSEERFSPRALVRWAGAPLALYTAYFLARWAYYGLPLPATYYAKSMVSALDPERGASYVWSALRESGLYAALPLVALGVSRRPTWAAALIAIYTASHAVYVAHVGGDWMPFNRFLLPIAPLLAAMFAWGTSIAWGLARAHHAVVRVGAGALLAATWLFVALRGDAHTTETQAELGKLGEAEHVKNHTLGLLKAAPLIRRITRQPGETLVTDYAGVFALYTDASVIDMWGLCNERIALHGEIEGITPIYGKTCARCYAEWKPIYFHANVPLLRAPDAFKSHAEVVRAVFQSGAIGATLDWGQYVAGRVVRESTNEAVFFLERRRPGVTFERREAAPGIVVEYPFSQLRVSRRAPGACRSTRCRRSSGRRSAARGTPRRGRPSSGGSGCAAAPTSRPSGRSSSSGCR